MQLITVIPAKAGIQNKIAIPTKSGNRYKNKRIR